MGLGFIGNRLLVGFDLPMRAVGRQMEIPSTRRLRSTGRRQARFGPRGRNAWAGSAACRLAAGPRAHAGARRTVMGRFLHWAEGKVVNSVRS
jgi:hypothetical protein